MLVELLTHAGEALDRSEARDRVDGYFARLQEMAAALPDGHKVSALVRSGRSLPLPAPLPKLN